MVRLLCALFFCAGTLSAVERQVAITIDDLPRGGDRGPTNLASIRTMTEQLLRPFREQKIPVTGFVNEGRGGLGAQALRQILDLWLDAGADLGNHSYSHLNLNDTPLDAYTADILKGEPVLRAALAARGRRIEFFRHPFLHTGPTPDVKRGLEQFLEGHGYRVAPVTIDTADYLFAAQYTSPGYRERVRREYIPYMESVVAFFERRSMEVLGREIPQILLIHASQMNADLMPELLAMFRRRGYTFVSLDEALRDPAYRLPDQFVSEKGISWIHRWGRTKGLPIQYEPDPPKWVEEGWRSAAQDPYRVAPGNYHFVFENEWARATRVTFSPHDRLLVHQHPPTPTTVYVYVTDGGAIRFNHVTGDNVAGLNIVRKPVLAGGIRFAHGAPETHTVEYLGDAPSEYARIELRTEPIDRPVRDVRLPPEPADLSKSSRSVRFENGQVRIVHVICAAGEACPASEHAGDPAVVVTISGPRRGEIEWSPAPVQGPLEQVQIELKSRPVNGVR
jgi:peptidoglycan/xylan/chitin deacetylase (PgdA/CDA1 family)